MRARDNATSQHQTPNAAHFPACNKPTGRLMQAGRPPTSHCAAVAAANVCTAICTHALSCLWEGTAALIKPSQLMQSNPKTDSLNHQHNHPKAACTASGTSAQGGKGDLLAALDGPTPHSVRGVALAGAPHLNGSSSRVCGTVHPLGLEALCILRVREVTHTLCMHMAATRQQGRRRRCRRARRGWVGVKESSR